MMNEEVRTVMSTAVTTVSPEQTVNDVLAIMERKRLQQLPVVENGKLVGLITSFDLWKNCRNNPDCAGDKVRDVMTTNVVRLAPKDKVGTAAELFMDRRFKTLPVVNLAGELKGVVTAFDIIRYSFKKEYPEPILYADRLV
ncbi:CBS domain-containing protein [Neolewinella lacunae]|uniref:CBS domain-containing protein n=1 Tax=Neolewinella lacunae TaxID=1517758 RepID=A0A923PSG7_9BACT|nr:CBS domain-containing protein [Neolewinella lacunae]MBC6995962.1 CBS domain-containing protein [Neolewinella lacunae]MDN3635194.1 CBS domain-containing protein [Neolewinella lacunae]